MLNKKAGMEIAVLILVFATLALLGFSIFIFATKEKSVQETIAVSPLIAEAYIVEEKVNFYIENGGERQEVAELFDVKTDGNGYIFDKEDKGVRVVYRFEV